jgi:hypothetical protein
MKVFVQGGVGNANLSQCNTSVGTDTMHLQVNGIPKELNHNPTVLQMF